MIIGILTIEIEIPHANSLKAKRAVLNRIKDRVHSRYNASIAEVDANDIWNYSELGEAVVSNDQKHANQVLSKLMDFLNGLGDFIVVDFSTEFIHI